MESAKEKKSRIMCKFSERYDECSSSQQGQRDAYEASYDKFMREMSKELLQESVDYERDHRKKTINTKFGQLEIPKQHVLCKTPLGFKMTPYWQEKCVYMGQQEVFEKQGSETLEKLTGQYVPSKQIEHMCHAYGQLLDTHQSKAGKKEPACEPDDVVYGMMDGSMILTREDD